MKKKYVILGMVLFLIICIPSLVIFVPPNFNLYKGDITLNYGEEYKEPGYKVTRYGHDYTDDVKVKNDINLNEIGDYKVNYSVKIGFMNFKKNRNVTIIDKEKPLITLNGDNKVEVCPYLEYSEQGYKAIDNYDGDITNKVTITEKGNTIYYTVMDSSNNKTEVTRELIKQDSENPKVYLKGESTQTVYVGSTYEDPGYYSNDNCDGDTTGNVTVNGKVDTSKVGTYKITYSVTDSSNNKAEVTRTVNVINKPSSNNGKPGVIYLTFDDGPKEGTTNVILDILKEEGVKATFFVTNSGPDYLIKREYDEGHTVALHTASHNYATVYGSVDSYYNDLKQVQDRVKRITGYESKIIRFPGGSSNTVSAKYTKGIMSFLTKDVINKGYRYYDWNISSGDAGEVTNSSGVYNNVVRNLSKNRANVILMHDIKPYTRDALRSIIQYGKNNGYTFERITMDTPMVTHGVNN